MYKKEEIEKLVSSIENLLKEPHEKYKVRECYKKILEKNKIKLSEKEKVYSYLGFSENQKEVSKSIEELLEKVPELKELELTKSQIFYKYFLETTKLNDENIKYAFCHFVEIEVSNLIKENVYKVKKINESKIDIVFKYDLKKLVENKLVNKLETYIRNCGKYSYYLENDSVATSEFISKNRQNEAFLRNIIGTSSSAYFSLRNILETENEDDITGRMKGRNVKNKDGIETYKPGEVDKIYEGNKEKEVKDKLKMFYGVDFEMGNKEEIEDFFVNIDEAISSIRHNVVHFNGKVGENDVFSFKNIVPSKIAKKIFNKEIDKRKLKLKIFRQLNSANVFDYFEEYKILDYLERTNFNFVNKNIPFVPSFTKLYNRIEDLKRSLEIQGKWKIPKRKESKDTQIYLLKNIYYGEFVHSFISNKDRFFEIKNKKTGFYKLKKFEEIKANSPKEYLAEIQSLYMINANILEEDEKNVYLEFIQKIFLKGFFEYLKENRRLSLLYIEDKENSGSETKKDKYDKLLKNWENEGEDLNRLPNEIFKFIRKIELDNFKYSKRMNMLYLILKLLNYKELTNLKGNLEKYQSSNKTNIFSEELQLINLVNLDNNKVTENFDLFAEEVGKFLKSNDNEKILKLEDLQKFDTKKHYADGKNIIKYRAFYNIKKYGMLDLLEKISDKASYKITKEDVKELKNYERNIENNYKLQEELHRSYQQKPDLLNKEENKEDLEKYKNSIKGIERYIHLKNKIEFNDLNLLQSLLLRMLHRLAGYTSIWERDLQFKLKGEFPENKYIDEIFSFDNSKNEKYKNGQIVDKYTVFLVDKEEEKLQEKFSKNKKNKLKDKYKEKLGLSIRNYIAHFNYVPKAKLSLLETLEKLRKLLSYDRKLKNAVMKSIKDIFKEYGFIVKFEISHENNQEKIKVKRVDSEEIKHLKNENLLTSKNSEDLCELVKVMLEYKKS